MATFFEFLWLAFQHQFGPRDLERQPLPDGAADGREMATPIHQAMLTKRALRYAAGIGLLYRILPQPESTRALDLACGRGLFTLSLAKYLSVRRVTGIDPSALVVAAASEGIAGESFNGYDGRIGFQRGEITNLVAAADNSADLVTLAHASHQLATIQQLRDTVCEMNRIVRPDGVVFLMDHARLHSQAVTENFARVMGRDDRKRGLPNYSAPLRLRMEAAWTPGEIESTLGAAHPPEGKRRWISIVPRGLPIVQIFVGLPTGRDLYLRPSWKGKSNPVIREWNRKWREQVSPQWARETLRNWNAVQWMLATAHYREIPLPAASITKRTTKGVAA